MKDLKSDIFKICRMISGVSWQESGIEFTSEKGNWRWNDLWTLLINVGCNFEQSTLKDIKTWSNEDRYRPHIGMPGEGHYCLAAQMGHVSLCRAYEFLVGRTPFITTGIDFNSHYRGYNLHNGGRTQGRLAMGSSFDWKGERVFVTNFKDDKGALIACSYHPNPEGYGRGSKIKHRYTITNKDLLEARKLAKQRIDPVTTD